MGRESILTFQKKIHWAYGLEKGDGERERLDRLRLVSLERWRVIVLIEFMLGAPVSTPIPKAYYKNITLSYVQRTMSLKKIKQQICWEIRRRSMGLTWLLCQEQGRPNGLNGWYCKVIFAHCNSPNQKKICFMICQCVCNKIKKYSSTNCSFMALIFILAFQKRNTPGVDCSSTTPMGFKLTHEHSCTLCSTARSLDSRTNGSFSQNT